MQLVDSYQLVGVPRQSTPRVVFVRFRISSSVWVFHPHIRRPIYTWSSDAHRCLPLRSTALKCPWHPSPSRTLRCDKVWHMLTAARDDMHMETLCTVILSLPPDVLVQLQSQLTLLSVRIGITCTTMVSKTCVICKQACTDWTRLATIVIFGIITNPPMQHDHPARFNLWPMQPSNV